MTYDDGDVAHISYVDATHDNLLYVNTKTKMPEVVDDGYHPEGREDAGRHRLAGVPPGRRLVVDPDAGGPVVDRLPGLDGADAAAGDQGRRRQVDEADVAGHAMPFMGSYGFYANLKVSNGQGVLSTYAINQQLDTPSFYVEVFAINLGIIQ